MARELDPRRYSMFYHRYMAFQHMKDNEKLLGITYVSYDN